MYARGHVMGICWQLHSEGCNAILSLCMCVHIIILKYSVCVYHVCLQGTYTYVHTCYIRAKYYIHTHRLYIQNTNMGYYTYADFERLHDPT